MRFGLVYLVVGLAGITIAVALLQRAGVQEPTATIAGCAIGFVAAEIANFMVKKR